MTIEEARQLAAQAWCKPNTSRKVMDVELAEAFANILQTECGFANYKLAAELVRLDEELAILKTPHTCGECAHFSGLNWSEKGACDALGIFQYNRNTLMLCGHFKQKKGTV